MPISYPSLPILIILSILHVLPLTSALLSCANVSCPPHPTSPITASQCNLSDSSYVAIGLTSLTLPFLSPPRDITWTMASQLHNTGNTSYLRADSLVVQKDFWVGSPEDVDLGPWGEHGEMSSGMETQGCAVFLWDNAVERLSLSTQGEDDREKSCAATVGEDCERDLIAQANGLLVNDGMRAEGSLEEKCGAVEAGLLRGRVPDSCKKVSAGDAWKSVKAVPLTGASGPQKIGSSDISNASTDCWPTIPKLNDLSFVWGYNDTSDVDSRKVNLVLSIFWTPDSNSSGQGQMSSEPNTQLICLWPVGLTEASVGSMQPSTAEHTMWSNRLLVVVGVILCVGLML